MAHTQGLSSPCQENNFSTIIGPNSVISRANDGRSGSCPANAICTCSTYPALSVSQLFLCPCSENHTFFLSWKCFCPLILHFCYNHHCPCDLDLSVSPSSLCAQQVAQKDRNIVNFKSVSELQVCKRQSCCDLSSNHGAMGGYNNVHCWEKLLLTECYKQGNSKYLESPGDSRVLLSQKY